MRTKLSLILVLPLILVMAVGVMATETDNQNPFAKEAINGCMLTDYEHSPPGAVCCAMITITVEEAVFNPFYTMTNSATTNAPATENTVFVITVTIYNVSGATDRASPAMAINENESAIALIQFDVYSVDDRASPANFAMWSEDGLINYANYVESDGMQYTAENSEVALVARRLVSNFADFDGAANLATYANIPVAISVQKVWMVDDVRDNPAAGSQLAMVLLKGRVEYPNPFNQPAEAIVSERRYPNPFA